MCGYLLKACPFRFNITKVWGGGTMGGCGLPVRHDILFQRAAREFPYFSRDNFVYADAHTRDFPTWRQSVEMDRIRRFLSPFVCFFFGWEIQEGTLCGSEMRIFLFIWNKFLESTIILKIFSYFLFF